MSIFDQAKAIPHGVQSITEWLGEGGNVVDRAESQRRANICLHCDENKEDWIVTGMVADAVRRHLEVKNHLKLRVVGEKNLGRCDVCQCVLRLLVHEPLDNVKRQMKYNPGEKYPEKCWKLE